MVTNTPSTRPGGVGKGIGDLVQSEGLVNVGAQLTRLDQLTQPVEALKPVLEEVRRCGIVELRHVVLRVSRDTRVRLALVGEASPVGQQEVRASGADGAHRQVGGAFLTVVVVNNVHTVVRQCGEDVLLLVVHDEGRSEGLHEGDACLARRGGGDVLGTPGLSQLNTRKPGASRPGGDDHCEVVVLAQVPGRPRRERVAGRNGSADERQKTGQSNLGQRRGLLEGKRGGLEPDGLFGRHSVISVDTPRTGQPTTQAPHLITHLEAGAHGAGYDGTCHVGTASFATTATLDRVHVGGVHAASIDLHEYFALHGLWRVDRGNLHTVKRGPTTAPRFSAHLAHGSRRGDRPPAQRQEQNRPTRELHGDS
eukprot:Hpha_TRINITY_DN15095_c0_g1::TRINITY_DN15095_c0_g1_i1::g.123017::m.123017